MKSNIFKILTIAALGLLTACSDDILMSPENQKPRREVEYSDTPVEIFAECGEEGLGTRGVEDAKKGFEVGEIIHVEASYYDESDQPIALEYDAKTGEPIRYHAYQAYQKGSDGSWSPYGTGAPHYWPVNAKYGEFKSYFVANMQRSLEVADRAHELKLSDVTDQTDPLYAFTQIDWGHKVNLRFTHLCTHLTFKNLDPDITDYYWLVNKKSGKDFHNVFTLRTTGTQKLEAEFISEGDEVFQGLVYVQRRAENVTDNNGVKTSGYVSFYLEPGDYSDIELRTMNNYAYLAYQSQETAAMQANTPYEIDIIKNKGVSYVEDEDNWDEGDDLDWVAVDPDTFLSTLEEGNEDYVMKIEDKDRTILRQTPEGWLLCYNVTFSNSADYGDYSLPNGIVFDGGNHYIKEVGKKLFTKNNGTIKRLGLKEVVCDVTLNQSVAEQWGIVCEENDGFIENLRIDDCTITYTIGTGSDLSGTVFNIGAVTGDNRGTISDLTFDEIEIKSKSGLTDVNCTLNIGGLVGQSVGPISDVSPVSNTSIFSVSHSLEGERATIYMGGVVGQASAGVANVIAPNVNVDSSYGAGIVGNTGGLVGRLRGTTGDPSLMVNCTVKGVVKGFKVSTNSSLNAYSYTGGLAGYNYNYDIASCRSLCDVEGAEGVTSDGGVIYATGGGFGRILNETNQITDNYIGGGSLTGPALYIGNFAGITPQSRTWGTYSSEGNDVKDLLGGIFIGANIDGDPAKE